MNFLVERYLSKFFFHFVLSQTALTFFTIGSNMPGSDKNSLSSIASMMKCITNTKPTGRKYPLIVNHPVCKIS
jgi:hypothetical protein